MSSHVSLDDLWNSAKPGNLAFNRTRIAAVPEAARRYLEHAIASLTPLASAVRLRMHGEIKLQQWRPFSAEQVICWNRGMIWRASVRLHGASIQGADSFIDGQGATRWTLFGILPVVNASGSDITRSAAGRVNIESIWLPSVLCSDDVLWTAVDSSRIHANFTAHSETAEIDYRIDEAGRLQSVSMPRWGNPEGSAFHYDPCGGVVENEATFDGYTIPVRMRVGWHFGTAAFESEGEFFRLTIEDAVYR